MPSRLILPLILLTLATSPAFAASHRATQAEIECQESFENLFRFRLGWRSRVIHEKNAATCNDIMKSSVKLLPAYAPACRKVKFAEVSKELQQSILAILKTGKNAKKPKPKMHRVYRQVIKKTVNSLGYFCRRLAMKDTPAEKWEPGMPLPAPAPKPSTRK